MEVTGLLQPEVAWTEVGDTSGVAEARRHAAVLAGSLGFEAVQAGRLAIAVTEVASNLVKHAGRGLLVYRAIERRGLPGIEVLSIDRGPGIANVAESLRDGHSTAGTPGNGLGAVQRLSSDFEMHSQPGRGTLARFVVWQRLPVPEASPVRAVHALAHGGISLPVAGEVASGDGWAIEAGGERVALIVVDGLGHGPEAAVAARAALAAFGQRGDRDAEATLALVHDRLRPTRGAAAVVAIFEPRRERCTFCGVGNIALSIRAGGASRSAVSLGGILGHQVRRFQSFSYPFVRGALCIAHTDGIGTRWDLATYAGLEVRHPALVCAALFRDHRRERDDATVVAIRHAAEA